MAKHDDPVKAYQEVYPNASDASAEAAAYRLLKRPEITEAVSFDKAIIIRKARREAIQSGKRRRKVALATLESRREVLAAMIHGDYMRRRTIKFNGELVEVEDDIPSYSVLRARELDCKLEAGYDWSDKKIAREAAKADKDKKPEKVRFTVSIDGLPIDEETAARMEAYKRWKEANPDRVKEEVRQTQNNGPQTSYHWPDDEAEEWIKLVKEEKAASGEKWETYFNRERRNGAESEKESGYEKEKQSEERGIDDPLSAPQTPLSFSQTPVFTQQKLTIQPASNPLPVDVMSKNLQAKLITGKQWELYRSLFTSFDKLPPAVRRLKEEWFKGLNRQGQQAHIDALRAQQKRRA